MGWGPFMRLALATGARRGELLALRWTDIDFERATLTIRGALTQTKGGVAEKGTKTDRVRGVALEVAASMRSDASARCKRRIVSLRGPRS